MITAGEATSSNLTKVQFAKIVNGSIVYDDGKNDHHVFGGKYEQIEELATSCIWSLYIRYMLTIHYVVLFSMHSTQVAAI